jgi:glycosyltransferase involved in cell wall biosynthesis
MNQNLISVIVPFINHEQYIQGCFENIIGQTYLYWELIFVDNGATDGSRQLVEKIASKESRIRVVDQKQKGIPHARNKGLFEARGKYVSFLDVDDRFHPEKLEKLIRILETFPEAGMAYGKTERIYVEKGLKVIQDWGIAKEGINFPFSLAIDWASIFYRLPQTGATLVRKDVALAVGGFPENLMLGNDDVGWHIEIALRYPIYFFPEVVVHYYRHAKSEGALLNEQLLVQQRYLDAHLNYIYPRGLRLQEETRETSLLICSEKGITGNAISLIRKGRKLPPMPITLHSYYRWIIQLHQMIPVSIANFLYKLSRRFMAVFHAQRFPLR